MYCTKCGIQLPNDSEFCTQCGAKVSRTAEAKSGQAAGLVASNTNAESLTTAETPQLAEAPAAAETRQALETPAATEIHRAADGSGAEVPQSAESLTQAVANTKVRARRRIPTIVLVALALALAAGAAYAAYRIYTDIWLPSQQEEQATTTEQPDEQAGEEETNEPGDDDANVREQSTEENASEEPAAEDVSNQITYGVASSSLLVSLPMEASTEWQYDTITASPESSAVDAINAAVATSIQADADTTAAVDLATTTIYCTLRSVKVSYMNDSIVSFLDVRYDDSTQSYGEFRNSGVTFDLNTGKAINPATLFGLDETNLQATINNALSIYFSANGYTPATGGYPSYLREESNVYMHFVDGSSKLYVTDKGLVIALDPYDYSTTEGRGTRSGKSVYIAVWDDADAGLVGTAASYSAME